MREIFQPLLFLFAQSSEADLRRQNEFLKAENEMHRKRVPKSGSSSNPMNAIVC